MQVRASKDTLPDLDKEYQLVALEVCAVEHLDGRKKIFFPGAAGMSLPAVLVKVQKSRPATTKTRNQRPFRIGLAI